MSLADLLWMGLYKAGVLQFQFQGTLQFNRLRDDPIKAAPVAVNKQNIRD
ncbi:hypothetical protein [Mesorhizobium sp. M7A.F.Ca.CA.002.04.1.1]|nr:hypothetical protein [Mesorhizobium sp. M7A.F.Ca.CA.002.04.1.1]